MINVNDIPKELMDKIKEKFDADPRIVKLRITQNTLQLAGKFAEALSIAKDIENLFNETVYCYMKEAEDGVEKIDLEYLDMPLEDKEHMLTLMMVLFMACDTIESAIIDIDDCLHKHDKDLHFEMFNDIRDISVLAKKKLKFLQENGDYMKDLTWADKCDNMYDMMKSKAKSIMNKRKHSKNWGENQEKLING